MEAGVLFQVNIGPEYIQAGEITKTRRYMRVIRDNNASRRAIERHFAAQIKVNKSIITKTSIKSIINSLKLSNKKSLGRATNRSSRRTRQTGGINKRHIAKTAKKDGEVIGILLIWRIARHIGENKRIGKTTNKRSSIELNQTSNKTALEARTSRPDMEQKTPHPGYFTAVVNQNKERSSFP